MYTYSLVQWLLFFYIYCFLGWMWESIYVSFKKKRWVNRGFMHGPLLPIYGSGAVIVLAATLPVKEHVILVFLFGMISATLLEYITGTVMEAIFHVRYWDYSEKPLNINGHICLFCSIAWGIFSVLMESLLHQPIERWVLLLPQDLAEILALLLTMGVIIDMTQSFNEAMDLKELLVNMTENSEEIKRMKKHLEAVKTMINDEAREWRQRAEDEKQVIKEALLEERKKYGEGSLSEELDKILNELKGIRQQMNRRQVFKSLKMLRRNPEAVSIKYTEALKRIQNLMEKRLK